MSSENFCFERISMFGMRVQSVSSLCECLFVECLERIALVWPKTSFWVLWNGGRPHYRPSNKKIGTHTPPKKKIHHRHHVAIHTFLACWTTTWDSCRAILVVLGVTVARFFNLAIPWCFHVQAPDAASMYILGGLAFCHMVGTNKHEWTKTSVFWKPG